jgi:hypothetical protein
VGADKPDVASSGDLARFGSDLSSRLVIFGIVPVAPFVSAFWKVVDVAAMSSGFPFCKRSAIVEVVPNVTLVVSPFVLAWNLVVSPIFRASISSRVLAKLSARLRVSSDK